MLIQGCIRDIPSIWAKEHQEENTPASTPEQRISVLLPRKCCAPLAGSVRQLSHLQMFFLSRGCVSVKAGPEKLQDSHEHLDLMGGIPAHGRVSGLGDL